jgi:hypothetical protein
VENPAAPVAAWLARGMVADAALRCVVKYAIGITRPPRATLPPASCGYRKSWNGRAVYNFCGLGAFSRSIVTIA